MTSSVSRRPQSQRRTCVTLPSSLRIVTSRQPESRSYPYPRRCLYRQSSRSRSRPIHAGPTQNWPPASTTGRSVVLIEPASAGKAVRPAASTRIEASVFIRASFVSYGRQLSARAAGSLIAGLRRYPAGVVLYGPERRCRWTSAENLRICSVLGYPAGGGAGREAGMAGFGVVAALARQVSDELPQYR